MISEQGQITSLEKETDIEDDMLQPLSYCISAKYVICKRSFLGDEAPE